MKDRVIYKLETALAVYTFFSRKPNFTYEKGRYVVRKEDDRYLISYVDFIEQAEGLGRELMGYKISELLVVPRVEHGQDMLGAKYAKKFLELIEPVLRGWSWDTIRKTLSGYEFDYLRRRLVMKFEGLKEEGKLEEAKALYFCLKGAGYFEDPLENVSDEEEYAYHELIANNYPNPQVFVELPEYFNLDFAIMAKPDRFVILY